MALDAQVRVRLEQVLGVVDDQGTAGPRLRDDARRLWARLRWLAAEGLAAEPPEPAAMDALELSAYALQLPQRRNRGLLLPSGRPARYTLRDRAEEASRQVLVAAGHDAGAALLDHTARILTEMPQRSPPSSEARLLADAVNLEDFGLIGLAQQMVHLTRLGDGVGQLAFWVEKREQYGYWEARLNDGFHFEPVRQIARRRVEHARTAAALLRQELEDDWHA